MKPLPPFEGSEELEPWKPLARWDPLQELDRMQHELDRLWSHWGDWPRLGKEAMTVAAWSPRVDITEDDQGYVVKAGLPGVKKEDLRVTVEEDRLSIRGERKTEREEKGRKFHRREWSYGSFERCFSLPPEIEASKITSEFKDGLLKVRVPKTHHPKSNAGEIKIR